MFARRPLVLYLRSPLNIWIATGCGALLVFGLVALPTAAAAAVVGGAAGLYAVATAALFLSRRGARAVVAQVDRADEAVHRAAIESATTARRRLEVLRVGDTEVRKAVELVLLESGRYLERARATGRASPLAGDQLRVALEICQAYLGELDESSTEGRYGVTDGDEGVDVRGRSIAALKQCALAIRRHATADLGGLDGTEAIRVIEETEES